MKDEILYYNNIQFQDYHCYSCGGKGHVAKYCKEIHFRNTELFKKSTNKNLKHINNREQYTRSHKEKFHAIISKPKLQSVANVIKYIYPEIGNPNKHINPHEMKIFKSRMNAEKTLNPDINVSFLQ